MIAKRASFPVAMRVIHGAIGQKIDAIGFADEKQRAQPALSVVIPTRNRGAVVGRAVRSALASQRLDVEVVVVDDGSSDETESSVSQIGDPRVRVHKLESTGNANRARNVGAMLSTGQVIAFLDSDDTFGPKRIDRLRNQHRLVLTRGGGALPERTIGSSPRRHAFQDSQRAVRIIDLGEGRCAGSA